MSYDNKRVFDMRDRSSGNRQDSFKPRPKPRPKKWQHQDDLEQSVGKTIHLQRSASADGSSHPASIEGVLISADQFTIKIRTKLGGEVTHFKHGLNSYMVSKNG